MRIVHQVLAKDGKLMYPTNDTDALQKIEGIEVRTLDVGKLIGAGIIHTKLWLVDGHHIYLGSANMDWRSFTEVSEAAKWQIHYLLSVFFFSLPACPNLGQAS